MEHASRLRPTPAAVPLVGHAHLLRPHLRVPDERPRLRAAQRAARGGGVRRGARRRRRRRRGAQHVRGAGERGQQALRQPRAPGAGEGEAARACRSPSAAAWRRRTAPRSPRRRRGSTSSSAPTTSARCRCCSSGRGCSEEAQVEILESLEVFPSTLPTRRESAYAAWVSVSVGCNNTCTFCIVPALRGKEKDRRPGDDPRRDPRAGRRRRQRGDPAGPERQRVRRGVRRPPGVQQAAARVRRGRGPGAGALHLPAPGRVHRRRHRGDGRDAERDAVAAHAAAVRLGPTCCTAMRRSYRQSKYLGIIDRVRAAMPDAAITTDIIVGFPGETEEDFQATLDVVRAARFAGAFTFQYSKRPGTPAADLPDQITPEVVQGPLPAPGRAGRRRRLGGERAPRRPAGRADGRRGRGPQGRRHPPALRPRPATTGSCTSPPRRGERPPRRHGHGRDHLRRSAPPGRGRRRLAVRRTRSGDAWEARHSRRRRRPASRSACRRRRPRPAAGRRRLPLTVAWPERRCAPMLAACPWSSRSPRLGGVATALT